MGLFLAIIGSVLIGFATVTLGSDLPRVAQWAIMLPSGVLWGIACGMIAS